MDENYFSYEVLLLSNTNIQNFIMYKISLLQQHLQTKHTIKLIKKVNKLNIIFIGNF